MTEIKSKLDKATEDADTFNKREALFGQEVTDYDNLAGTQKDFEPYSVLWTAIHDWVEKEEAWTKGPLVNMDPETVEREIAEMNKFLNRSVRFFEKNEMKEITASAETIRNRLQAFKPYLP